VTKTVSPSPMLESFVRNVREDFPRQEAAKADQFEERISRTTSEKDRERAHRCLHWAVEMADDKSQSHPRWRQIKELHKEWKDTWFGAEFGLMGAGQTSHSPGMDVHIRWVEDAVLVAKTLGEEDGWDRSPWEELLKELIDLESD
jgi:hypothetical protein